MKLRQCLEYVEKKLHDPEYYTYSTLAYMLRDCPETREPENERLMLFCDLNAFPDTGYTSNSDIQFLVDRLDKYLKTGC